MVLAVAGVAAVGPPDADGVGRRPRPGRPVQGRRTRRHGRTDRRQTQEDRTAPGVPGTPVRLLDEILSVVPAGFTAPQDPPDRPVEQLPLRDHQAQFEERVKGVDVWSYSSSAALAQGQRMGRLLVEVHTKGNQLPAEPCSLADVWGGGRSRCGSSGGKVGWWSVRA